VRRERPPERGCSRTNDSRLLMVGYAHTTLLFSANTITTQTQSNV
jgi:hypothetical protein